MKKAGIITLYSENNYGNKLQNYAVVKCLDKWGYRADTLVERTFKGKMFEQVRELATGILKPIIAKRDLDGIRRHKFHKFSKKYLSKKYICKTPNGISTKITEKYDAFVTGSDQVWNPTYWSDEAEADKFLLAFVPKEKRYCFSPSIGMSEFPEKWQGKFIKELGEYTTISCREEDGSRIIKELTGREAAVTIDPTMMLNKEEWCKVSKEVRGLPENFVLEYFLGKVPKDEEGYISSPQGCERIKLLDKSNKKIYTCDPSEFIYLVSKANVVYTDSFHACVFSILFGKPFKVFKRISGMKTMFSRIETLLGMFGVDANECVGKEIQIDPKIRDEVLKEKRNLVEQLFKGL